MPKMVPAAALLLTILLCGCAAPFSVTRLNTDESYQQSNRSALTGGTPSNDTFIVLRRHGLLKLWQTDPNAAIASLRADVVGRPALWQELFSLAELSYLQAKRDKSEPEFLAAAIYAYAYLDPGGTDDQPSPFSKQFRQAGDIYNLGLTWALTPPDKGAVPIVSTSRDLPFGSIALTVDPNDLDWRGGKLALFQSTANLQVNGITNVYSTDGLGAPLAAKVAASADPTQGLDVSPELRVPANLMLVIDHPRQEIAQTALSGRLSIHTIYDKRDVYVDQDHVPLSYDQSATLALGLSPTPSRLQGLVNFLNGTVRANDGRLIAVEPHRPGYMPVIFIHGTTSSSVTWAGMVNDLLEVPAIRGHFEFWFFTYSSSNPIPYSAMQLRQAIAAAEVQLGGPQADPALGRITLVGHSQGGLIAKMLVIDPGPKLWDDIGLPPIASLKMSEKSKALAQAMLFPKPVPEVQRVIFLSTPQHGSFLAGFSIAQFFGNLIRLPLDLTSATAEVFGGNGSYLRIGQRRLRMGSIQGMSPRSPFIQSLADIPIAPGVHAHSIISVDTDGPVTKGNDGVVSYASAHITGVDSELVVRSSHSSQDNPAAIAEVERILLLQLAASPDQTGP